MSLYGRAQFVHPSPARIRVVAALAMLGFLLGFAGPLPARADGAASTRNIILGAAAVVAAIVISNNARHARNARDTVVGRTSDGGLVYGDGRVVYPNGDVLYTSNGDGRRCGYGGDDNEERCGQYATAYYPRGYHGDGHDGHGRHGHHHDGGDQDEHGDHGDD
jgi:hypothetical protein